MNTNIQSVVKKEKLNKNILSKLSNLISVIIRSLFAKRVMEEKNKINIDLVRGLNYSCHLIALKKYERYRKN